VVEQQVECPTRSAYSHSNLLLYSMGLGTGICLKSRQSNQGATKAPEIAPQFLLEFYHITILNDWVGAKMANASVSKTFSVESVWDPSPLGYHVGWLGVHHEQIWDNKRQVAHVLEYCPEVKIILGMQLAGDKPESVKKVEGEKQEEEERKRKEKQQEEIERVKKKVDKMAGK
jgi:hypothetical protein